MNSFDVAAWLAGGYPHTVREGSSDGRTYVFEENGTQYSLKTVRGDRATEAAYACLVGIDATLASWGSRTSYAESVAKECAGLAG